MLYNSAFIMDMKNYLTHHIHKAYGYRTTFNLYPVILVLNLLLSTMASAELYRTPVKKLRESGHSNDHVVHKRAVNETEHRGKHQSLHNLHGQPGMGYYIEMGIGTPPQMFNILVDTGSSNFAVAASPDPDVEKYFNSSISSTYSYDGTTVNVVYTQGEWTGPLAYDQVTAPSISGLNVSADIAFITESKLFFQNDSNWQGILGLGYQEIAKPDTSVVPFLDSLKQQSEFADVFSIQLCGVRDTDQQTGVSTGGTLVLGGTDKSLYHNPLVYTPLYKEWYYEVIITDMKVAGKSLEMDCKEYNFDKSIVDSGTTNLRLPNKVYDKFVNMVRDNTKILGSGGTITPPPPEFWVGGSLLCWDEFEMPWLDFPVVTISLVSSEFSTFDLQVAPQQYLRQVPDVYNASLLNDCYKFAVTSSDTGTVLGAVFMEGFYVVFDRENKRVGFAQTTCSSNLQNAVLSNVESPRDVKFNTTQCAYMKPSNSMTALNVATYVMITLALLCLIPMGLFVFQCQYHKHCRKKPQSDVSTIDENNLLDTEPDSRKYYRALDPYR